MKILFIGDIVGEPGRRAVAFTIPKLKKCHGITLVVANGENVAGGSGITPALANELFDSGIDVLTSGDHVWKRKEIFEALGSDPRLVRPANYPSGAPGFGSTVVETPSGSSVGVINLVGRVFMQPVECPFRVAKEEVARLKKKTPVIIVDMHAEATSEKVALGWYLDGMVSAIVGTHTHIQTADERILPGGTAYITDVGMTGPCDSVIGRKKEQVLSRFVTQIPTKFEVADGDIRLHGVIIDIDEKSGRAASIERVQEKIG